MKQNYSIMMLKCQHCKQEHPGDTKFCPQTGKAIKYNYCRNKDCPICEKESLPYDYIFCPECGKKIYNPLENPKKVNTKGVLYYLKRISILTLLGVIGTWYGIYLTKKSPNIAKQINEELQIMQKEYEILKPTPIPDSLIHNENIYVLQDFQKEFEILKLKANSLDFSNKKYKNSAKEIFDKLVLKYIQIDQILQETDVLCRIAQNITNSEKKSISSFPCYIDFDKMDSLVSTKEQTHEIMNIMWRGICEVNEKIGKEKNQKRIDEIYGEFNEKYEKVLIDTKILHYIESLREFTYNFYLVVNIRIKEYMREDRIKEKVDSVAAIYDLNTKIMAISIARNPVKNE